VKDNTTRNKIQQFINDSNHASTTYSESIHYAKARANNISSSRSLVIPTQASNQSLPLIKASITNKNPPQPLPLIKANTKRLSDHKLNQSNNIAAIASQPAQKPTKTVTKKTRAKVMTAKQTAVDNPIIADVRSGLTLSASLQPNVDFWIKVFAKWDLHDFVYHDDQYLKIIYKTVQTPSINSGDKIADSDREHLRQQKSILKKELKALELSVANKTPLSLQQQQRYDQIVAVAGKSAISGISERLRYQRGQRSRYLKGLKIEAKYIELFKALFKAGNVPHGIAYLPHVESSFRNSVTSSANATGMWQFTKGAKDIFMIKSPAVDERVDPVASARGAVRYMQAGYRYLDSWPLAVTSYNHGIGGMRKAKKAAGSDLGNIHNQYRGKNFGFASRNFYPELIAVRYISHNRDKYFGNVKVQSPLDIAAFILPKDTLLKDLLAQWKYTKVDLEPLNPAILDAGWRSSSPLPKGFIVWLPKQALSKITETISTRDIDKLSTAMLQALPEPKL
jgi:membrane-bound lytic murein transglycosylase D